MTGLIIAFGILTFMAGVLIIINPGSIFKPLEAYSDKLSLHILAVIVRLVLGALLVSQSEISNFPFVIVIIGWLSIIAAIFLAVIGRNNFKRLMAWAFSLLKPFGRIGGILATAFGAFIVFAFI